MRFVSLQHSGFRNLVSATLSLDATHVIFLGENGQGKTNLLEALYMVSYGTSFRTRRTRHMIHFSEDRAALTVCAVDGEQTYTVKVVIEAGSVRMFLDGKEVRDRKEVIRLFPVIVFSHEDIQVVSGPPEDRRRFFDQTLCLYDQLYLDDLRRYYRVLRQRNQAVKDQDERLLSVYDIQLADIGITVCRRREEVVEAFNGLFPGLYASVSGMDESLHIRYRPSWETRNTREEVCRHLHAGRDRDRVFQTTTSGPHRDRFFFIARGKQFTDTASTGQQRLVSLVLRSAQAAFYRERTKRLPVLLLDDVLLELDPGRRKRFLASLTGYDQAIFTFLPDEEYGIRSLSDESITYRVAQGAFHETFITDH